MSRYSEATTSCRVPCCRLNCSQRRVLASPRPFGGRPIGQLVSRGGQRVHPDPPAEAVSECGAEVTTARRILSESLRSPLALRMRTRWSPSEARWTGQRARTGRHLGRSHRATPVRGVGPRRIGLYQRLGTGHACRPGVAPQALGRHTRHPLTFGHGPRLARHHGCGGSGSAGDSDPSRRHLDAEQSSEIVEAVLGTGPYDVPPHVGKITTIPADTEVVDGALRLVVALARATVGGADGVSVSLRRHGHLATVAASDQTIADMDASQYATGEGPCVDASVNGRWFHAESLDTETRWPAFTPRAQALGINAILSSPLLAEDRPVGALNIYSRTAMAFAPKDQELASVFATEASLVLTSAGVDVTDEQLSSRRNEALATRRLIAQAEGVIMEREGVEADGAYSMLCDYSRTSNRPFREWAEDVVASTQRSRLSAESEPRQSHDG